MNLRGALHDDSLSRATPRYELHGDIFDVAPDTSECSTDEQYVNKVIMWKSISNDTKDEEHDLQLAFIPFAQYNVNAYYMPFAEEIAYSNGFAASLDDSYPVTKYSVMVINACLVGFDEIANLILSDMKDDELPELHYEPNALMIFTSIREWRMRRIMIASLSIGLRRKKVTSSKRCWIDLVLILSV